ncbi:MAG: rhomboid family intramembrane serine protease [Methyloligellaceae bacterium]
MTDAPLTYALLVMNIIVSGYAFYMDRGLIERYSLHVGAVLRNKEYYRLITSGFLHGHPFHLLFNILTLYYFGSNIEAAIGSSGFGIVYLGSLIISGAVAVYIKRYNWNYSAIGASGAITGIVFSFCLFWPTAKLYLLFIPVGIPAIIFAAIYTAYSMYAMNDRQTGGGIAHEAHPGGSAWWRYPYDLPSTASRVKFPGKTQLVTQ